MKQPFLPSLLAMAARAAPVRWEPIKDVKDDPGIATHGVVRAASESCHATNAKENVISLAGGGRFELDRQDAGFAGRWFDKALSGTIGLPGTVSTRNLGDPTTGIRQQIWGGKFTDQPLGHPMIRSDYQGNAWYQVTVEVPAAWTGQSVELFLERVCWVSEAWIDGRSAGVIDTLSAPHRHQFGQLTPGQLPWPGQSTMQEPTGHRRCQLL